MSTLNPHEVLKNSFNRDCFTKELDEVQQWDILIIGGGATGLGTAVDAASRGLKTLLLEQSDFAKGTSSRSTKLVHGGVRYLEQGNISLVQEALRERGLLLQNAPHLVHKLAFIIPCYTFFSKLKYLVGLKLYDWLSGKRSFGKSTLRSKSEVIRDLPQVQEKNLSGGVEYFDGQFDDARLAINLAQTSAEQGGVLINYMKVTALLKNEQGFIQGVKATDLESDREYTLSSAIVINATGVFVDEILKMENPNRKPLVSPSQGVHVVLNRSFLKGDKGMMIPKTADGRVLFVLPWHHHILLGTTDTPLSSHSLEPVALAEEIDFILTTADQYLTQPPKRADVLSVFAGLRPLAAPEKETSNTKEISRSHKLIVDKSKLITITGGKWTTYRKMAEDTVDKALNVGKLVAQKCMTKHLNIHGYLPIPSLEYRAFYGTDAAGILELEDQHPAWALPIIAGHPYTPSEVIWAARHEMARTVEDVLARRMRVLFLDARLAQQMASKTADILAEELNKSDEWKQKQLKDFLNLSQHYILS